MRRLRTDGGDDCGNVIVMRGTCQAQAIRPVSMQRIRVVRHFETVCHWSARFSCEAGLLPKSIVSGAHIQACEPMAQRQLASSLRCLFRFLPNNPPLKCSYCRDIIQSMRIESAERLSIRPSVQLCFYFRTCAFPTKTELPVSPWPFAADGTRSLRITSVTRHRAERDRNRTNTNEMSPGRTRPVSW